MKKPRRATGASFGLKTGRFSMRMRYIANPAQNLYRYFLKTCINWSLVLFLENGETA